MRRGVGPSSPPGLPTREAIHDLRNLFGIVASAQHLLNDNPASEKRALLLDAIAKAADRGGALTTGLLACRAPDTATRLVEVNRQIAQLEPMLRAITGTVELHLDLGSGRAITRIDADALEAALVELVTNARAACGRSGKILIRTRRARGRLWLMVADNGCGMDAGAICQVLTRITLIGAHGTGIGRIRLLAAQAHGRLRIRSRTGRGTVVCLNLPTVLGLATGAPALPPARRSATIPAQPVLEPAAA